MNIACLHKDAVKTALYDVGIMTDRSYEIFKTFVEHQLANQVDLIVEATMHGEDAVAVLETWRDRYDLDLTCVICEVDRDVRRRRIETRARHVAHAAADRQLLDLEMTMDYSKLPGRRIAVITDRTPEASAALVLDQMTSQTSPEP